MTKQESGSVDGDSDAHASTYRTSTGCCLHNEEIPRFRDRIAQMTRTQVSQAQCTKVSRYSAGQFFVAHSDATPGLGTEFGASSTDYFGDLTRLRKGCEDCEYPGGNV